MKPIPPPSPAQQRRQFQEGGTTLDGCTFLVHGFVEGPSLADIISASRHCPGADRRHPAPAFVALAAIHARMILHRDIKPSNLVVSPNAGRAAPFRRRWHPEASSLLGAAHGDRRGRGLAALHVARTDVRRPAGAAGRPLRPGAGGAGDGYGFPAPGGKYLFDRSRARAGGARSLGRFQAAAALSRSLPQACGRKR